MPAAFVSIGSLPAAWIASQWNSAPARWARSASSTTGWIVPISLFTHITDTSATSGPSASASRSTSTMPFGSGGTIVSGIPRDSSTLAVSSTDGCSIADTTSRRRPAGASASTPLSARLLASEPVAVNTTSSGRDPTSAATRSRAPATASRAASPRRCTEDGLPNRSSRNGRIASTTSAAGAVVAA